MIKKIISLLLFIIITAGLMAGAGFYHSRAREMSVEEKEAANRELINQMNELKEQIREYEDGIDQKKKEQKTLNRELTILESQAKKQELEIKKTQLYISQLKVDIQDKEQKIKELEDKGQLEKVKLTQYLHQLNEYDNVGILEMMLKYESLSDFFSGVAEVEVLQKETYDIIQEIKTTKTDLTGQIDALEEDKSENLELKSIQELQKFSLDQKKGEKKNLISQTRGQEKKFQELIKQNKKKIADIQSRLFELGSLGVGRITIEKAMEYAEFAGSRAGIRPALLLGLVWVETKLNSNLGTGNWRTDLYECYIDLSKQKNITRAKRDAFLKTAEAQKEAFFEITSKLFLNPDKAPVSKALRSVGCGGAMGVAQFMPTTWQGYESKIAQLSGHNPPSPWSAIDGFVGSAIKLANDGATSQTREGERRAAAMYYAGGRWQREPGQNYADRVRFASFCYQNYMDALKRGDQNIDIDTDCEKYF